MALFWALYWVSCRWAGACPSLPSLPAPSWRPPAPTGERRRSWEILGLPGGRRRSSSSGSSGPRALFSIILCFLYALYTSARLYLNLSVHIVHNPLQDQLTGGPSTPGELNPLAPGDSIVVFGFVLSYSKLYSCFIHLCTWVSVCL